MLKKHTLNPEITLLLINLILKKPCLKFPKSAIWIFGLKMRPPPPLAILDNTRNIFQFLKFVKEASHYQIGGGVIFSKAAGKIWHYQGYIHKYHHIIFWSSSNLIRTLWYCWSKISSKISSSSKQTNLFHILWGSTFFHGDFSLPEQHNIRTHLSIISHFFCFL